MPSTVGVRRHPIEARSVAALAAFVAASYLPALLAVPTMQGYDAWYAGLSKPSWTPPGVLIGSVWTVLYALMGVAAWLAWREGGWRRGRAALVAFFAQLALNAAWTPIFFGAHAIRLALLDILLLWLALASTLVLFWRLRPAAGALLAPYLAWVTFAAGLNAAIVAMNA